MKLTVETCFHYLSLSANDIPDGRPEFKCCPPIRNESNRDQLWKALLDGDIDCVVSDHSPCVIELKKVEEGDIMAAWGGINSLGLGLSLLWTEGRKPERGATLSQIVNWMSKRTAEHAGLDAVKGSLGVGLDGDFVIWDAEAEIKGSICFLACPPRPDTKTLGVERTVPLQKQVLCVRGTRSQRTCAADVFARPHGIR